MPSARSRSTMRARVRSDVMQMPLVPAPRLPTPPIAPSCATSTLEPRRHAGHLVAIGQVDLQRRDRDIVAANCVKVRAFARIGGGTRCTHPVDGLAARALHADDVLGLVPAAKARNAITAYVTALDIGNVDVEQP